MTSPSPVRSAARRSSGRITSNSTGQAIALRMASGTESSPGPTGRRQLLILLIVCQDIPPSAPAQEPLQYTEPVLNPTYSSDQVLSYNKCHSLNTTVKTVKPDFYIKL